MKIGDNTDARGRRRAVSIYDCSWQRQSAQPTTRHTGPGKATSCQAYARSFQLSDEVLHGLRVQVHMQVHIVKTRTDLRRPRLASSNTLCATQYHEIM